MNYINGILRNRQVFVIFMIAFAAIGSFDIVFIIVTSDKSPVVVVAAGMVTYLIVAIVTVWMLKLLGLWSIDDNVAEKFSDK